MTPLSRIFLSVSRFQPASIGWLVRQIAGLICLSSVMACELPRVGPTRAEIIADLNTNETNLIVEVDAAVARKPQLSLPWAFLINSNQPPCWALTRYSLVIR